MSKPPKSKGMTEQAAAAAIGLARAELACRGIAMDLADSYEGGAFGFTSQKGSSFAPKSRKREPRRKRASIPVAAVVAAVGGLLSLNSDISLDPLFPLGSRKGRSDGKPNIQAEDQCRCGTVFASRRDVAAADPREGRGGGKTRWSGDSGRCLFNRTSGDDSVE